jgi:catecholate siderophore receptor
MPNSAIRRATFVAAAAIFVLGAVPALHAQAVAPDTSTRRAKPDSTRRATTLQPVRVIEGAGARTSGYAAPVSTSATKTPTLLIDIPQSVTVISHDLMADASMQGMADVVRYVPGVVMTQGEGNRDQPVIRGNNTSADLFIDGMRDDIQFFRDLYNIERVEAVTGPSAMIFGRGNGGGVLNRISKQPTRSPSRAVTLQTGSFDNKRAMVDVDQPLSDAVAVRVNGMYENSGNHRDDVRLRRYGFNPVLAYSTRGANPTTITARYERFNDHRTADRGVPSFNGAPFDAEPSTFFGNPEVSYANATVDAGDLIVTRAAASGLRIQNHSRWAAYDKIYQNAYPGSAVNAAGTTVNLSAYNNAARRHNLFNQTDVTYTAQSGPVRHTLLAGVELGRQVTDNFRNTGYFNDTARTFAVPVSDPTVDVPVTFRQSATDADNHNVVIANSIYVQDQIAFSPRFQAVAGLRAQSFDLTYHNNRGDTTYARRDQLLSPRAGLLYKPVDRLSLYTSYSISHLPSSGDQFSSLNPVTESMKPERFTNVEAGAKWQARDGLVVSAAVYRLDRTNTRAPDPLDPTVFVQTGESRSTGVEVSAFGNITSRWQLAGAYTNQIAKIVSRTTAAAAGATPAIVPHTVASLWNKVEVTRRVGLGGGATRQSDMYAAVDNTVRLRGYTRFDGAVFVSLAPGVRAQLNVENLLNRQYFATANNNNNISPGAPRSLRVSLVSRF